MSEPADEAPERAALHQVANLLAIIETQAAVVRMNSDPTERGERAVEAMQWIEQSARETQRLVQVWRQQERGLR